MLFWTTKHLIFLSNSQHLYMKQSRSAGDWIWRYHRLLSCFHNGRQGLLGNGGKEDVLTLSSVDAAGVKWADSDCADNIFLPGVVKFAMKTMCAPGMTLSVRSTWLGGWSRPWWRKLNSPCSPTGFFCFTTLVMPMTHQKKTKKQRTQELVHNSVICLLKLYISLKIRNWLDSFSPNIG